MIIIFCIRNNNFQFSLAFFLKGWLLILLKRPDLIMGRMLGLNIAILARAVGVPVIRRSGGQLAMMLVPTINVIIFSILFHIFSPPRPFLIEGVLGSKNLFSLVPPGPPG